MAEWILATESLPEGNAKHGYSQPVIVNVVCHNGVVFRDVDRYDSHSKTWEKHHSPSPEYGPRVTHWQELPPAPDGVLVGQEGKTK